MKRNCVTVAPTTLTRIVGVRIPIPLPKAQDALNGHLALFYLRNRDSKRAYRNCASGTILARRVTRELGKNKRNETGREVGSDETYPAFFNVAE